VNRLRYLIRRVGAVAIGALLGLASVVAVASPASADHTEVSGACVWDAETGGWLVTWTVTPGDVDGAAGYRLAEANATPADAPVEGLPVGDELTGDELTGDELTGDELTGDEFGHLPGEQLTGEQRLPAGTEAASLAVRVEWDNGHLDGTPRVGEVLVSSDCAVPDPGIELGQWSFDCGTLTITVTNPSDRELPVTFVPSAGDPVSAELPSGESTTVQFPSAEGLSVDLRSTGRSIADPASPIEITAAEWAESDCDSAEAGGGGGGGLATTGTPVRVIIGGAVALLALGAALFVVARRRRVRFTA
jgi:hypothetical protein